MSRCPECGGFEMDISVEGKLCRNCGLVLDDAPFEQNPFVPDSKKSYTEVSCFSQTKPVNGKYVQHHWLKSTREKNLYKAKNRLGSIASKLRIPQAVERDAFVLFRTVVEKDLNVGRDNTSMLYACVYASCMLHDIPKTPLEIISFSEVDRTKMLRSFRLVKKGLKLNLRVDPIDLVQRFGSRLRLKQTTITLAIELISKLKETNFTAGKQPKTIVASALYIASGMNNDQRTQRDVANASGVIEVTIRRRSHEIMEIIDEI